MKTFIRACTLLALAALVTGCATPPAYDYTAYREARPASILILPPLNETPEVKATYGMLSQMTAPLAEAGYYVMPVALVDETFRQNGLANAADIHQVEPAKLREIFGADAALYVTVVQYGSTYTLIDSSVKVEAKANLVDLRTGKLLWSGSAFATDQNSNNSGGLVGMLITAAVKQVMNTLTDATYPVAGMASGQLLSAGRVNGILHGPRSPQYGLE
ncbi:MAG TPA: DUF799 domain-containing protein [Pseudomonas sp.]|nr:DUF799 domain-containing protein [Pseudomonas sp.]